MTTAIFIHVAGTAAPQGSKRHVGGGRLVESSKALKPWRQKVVDAATNARERAVNFELMDGPLEVDLMVYFLKPKSTKFPLAPAGTPDLDKLQRAVGDALTIAKVIKDDARIVSWHAQKNWVTDPAMVGINVWVGVLQAPPRTMVPLKTGIQLP